MTKLGLGLGWLYFSKGSFSVNNSYTTANADLVILVRYSPRLYFHIITTNKITNSTTIVMPINSTDPFETMDTADNTHKTHS